MPTERYPKRRGFGSVPDFRVRTREERLIDQLLTLRLMDQVRQAGGYLNKTKSQKAIFHSEYNLAWGKTKALNFTFFRHHFGPFSAEVAWTLDQFQELGIANTKYMPTPEGEDILEECAELLETNAEITRVIDDVAELWAKRRWQDMKGPLYSTMIRTVSNPGVERKLGDIPMKELLLAPLRTDGQPEYEVFQLSDGWLETLDVLFDATEKHALDVALESARAEGHEDVDVLVTSVAH